LPALNQLISGNLFELTGASQNDEAVSSGEWRRQMNTAKIIVDSRAMRINHRLGLFLYLFVQSRKYCSSS
jgi:hypothetical protein